MLESTPVALALGSNVGRSGDTLRRALRVLSASALSEVVCAPLYRTPALLAPGAPPQEAYLNTAAVGSTTLTAEALLAVCKQVERLAGRRRDARWSPRRLDIDLLLFGDRESDLPELTLPHPRLSERAFYLVPLAEIAPELRDPRSGATIRELLARLPQEEIRTAERIDEPHESEP